MKGLKGIARVAALAMMAVALAMIGGMGMAAEARADNGQTIQVADANDLEAALGASGTAQTVQLSQNITLSKGLDVAREVTLDLNGHTLTNDSEGTYTGDYLLAVKYGGKLTVTDSSAASGSAGSGKI